MKKLFIVLLVCSSFPAFSMEFRKRDVVKGSLPLPRVTNNEKVSKSKTRLDKKSIQNFCDILKFTVAVGGVVVFAAWHNMQQHCLHQ